MVKLLSVPRTGPSFTAVTVSTKVFVVKFEPSFATREMVVVPEALAVGVMPTVREVPLPTTDTLVLATRLVLDERAVIVIEKNGVSTSVTVKVRLVRPLSSRTVVLAGGVMTGASARV